MNVIKGAGRVAVWIKESLVAGESGVALRFPPQSKIAVGWPDDWDWEDTQNGIRLCKATTRQTGKPMSPALHQIPPVSTGFHQYPPISTMFLKKFASRTGNPPSSNFGHTGQSQRSNPSQSESIRPNPTKMSEGV